MTKINKGEFNGNTYYKRISINKAVLWKTRQISLPPDVVKQFKPKGITKVVFIDQGKNERWEAPVDKLREHYELKQVGQEPQYYFPIELFSRKLIHPERDETLCGKPHNNARNEPEECSECMAIKLGI